MEHCILYLDASGDQGWPRPIGTSKNEWHVLAGIVINSNQDLQAKTDVMTLLEQYSPYSIRSKFESKYHELHYNAIRYRQDIFQHLTPEQSDKLIDDVFQLITKLKPTLMSISVKKDQLYKKYTTPENPKLLAVRSLINKYSMYLSRKQLIGSIVYDAEEYRKDVELRNMMYRFRGSGAELRGTNHSPHYIDTLPNVLNSINLCPSEMSPGIQLTDFCAKAIWLYRERGIDSRFNQIKTLYEINTSNARLYDDTVFPNPAEWF